MNELRWPAAHPAPRVPSRGVFRAKDDTGESEAPRPRGATRPPTPEEIARDPRRPVRLARGVSAVLVVLTLVGTLQAGIMIAIEARRWWNAEREIARLQREVTEFRREAADLTSIAERGDDLRFREHLARRQGYVYPDEVRYVIVPLPEPGPAAPP